MRRSVNEQRGEFTLGQAKTKDLSPGQQLVDPLNVERAPPLIMVGARH